MLNNKDAIHDEWLAENEKFESLPVWAGVLFALRCAHRVYPLIDHFCSSPCSKAKETILRGLEVGYGYGTDLLSDRSTYRGCYNATRKAKEEITHAVGSTGRKNSVAAAYAAEAAEVAVAATVYASLDLNSFYKSARATRSLAALAAKISFGDGAAALVTKSASIDLRLLERQVNTQIDQNKRPSGLGFLGPLWPVGKPVGWIDIPAGVGLSGQNETGEQHLIRAFGPVAVRTQVDSGLNGTLDEFLNSLSDLNETFGGSGIQFTSQSTKVSFYEDAKSNRRTTERQGWFVAEGNIEYTEMTRATLQTLDLLEEGIQAGLSLPEDYSLDHLQERVVEGMDGLEILRDQMSKIGSFRPRGSSWHLSPTHPRLVPGATNGRAAISVMEAPERSMAKRQPRKLSANQQTAVLEVIRKTKAYRDAGGNLELVSASFDAIRTQLAGLL
ncbi:MAG: hypothetical protein ACFCD0_09025 [Gemmataceae bacterium]